MSDKTSPEVVSTKPASGFRDFVGSQAEIREWLYQKISSVYRSYGFESIETPALESLDVLFGSGGQENEKLIFKTLKRGEKLDALLESKEASSENLADLGLRFDLTVPLCRVFAQSRSQISLPWKVFHIGPVWRAERPQKGRFREFIQCDVDIVGSSSIVAELEVIQAVTAAFAHVGVRDLSLQINHREFLQGIASKLGILDRLNEFAVLLDKKDKMPIAKLQEELEKFLQKNLPSELGDLIEGRFSIEKAEKYAPHAIQATQKLIELCEGMKLPLKEIVFDPSLVRGMGYYTGNVFEFKHASAGYAFGGGGRYDKLIGRFSKTEVPAVGCSIGFERLLLFLEEIKYQAKTMSCLFLPVMDEKLRGSVNQLAARLRTKSFRVDVYADESKIKNQFKYASAKNYPWVVILGEDELKSGQLKLKNMEAGTETLMTEADLLKVLTESQL